MHGLSGVIHSRIHRPTTDGATQHGSVEPFRMTVRAVINILWDVAIGYLPRHGNRRPLGPIATNSLGRGR